jgi:hypothetical protein
MRSVVHRCIGIFGKDPSDADSLELCGAHIRSCLALLHNPSQSWNTHRLWLELRTEDILMVAFPTLQRFWLGHDSRHNCEHSSIEVGLQTT